MGKDHRFFHRRAAQAATQIVTFTVDVVATVDSNGNLIAQETISQQTPAVPTPAADIFNSPPSIPTPVADAVDSTPQAVQSAVAQAVDTVPAVATPVAEVVPSVASVVADVVNLKSSVPLVVAAAANSTPSPLSEAVPVQPSLPSVPSVPAVPSVSPVVLPSVPAVPSVPSFPSNLLPPSVPPYPWPSGVPVAQSAASTGLAQPSPAISSKVASSAAPAPAAVSIGVLAFNSTTPSTPASVIAVSSFTGLNSIPVSSAPSASQSLDPSPKLSGSGTVTDSVSDRSTSITDAAVTTFYGGGGGGVPGNTAAPAAATTPAGSGGGAGSSPALLETPQVVGSVVGSLAGAAFILAIILLLIRRHKRQRGGTLQLTGDDHTDNHQPIMQTPSSNTILPSAFLHRFSAMSKSTIETNTSGGERSFQRVSGRKLPSAFSEGMTSEQFSRGGHMSESSFYQDDQGTYGGPGVSKEFGKETGDLSAARASGPINFRPSPARTPIIRHADDDPPFGTNRSYLSPPTSPNPDLQPGGTLGRTLASADGSRSSRFTENV